MLGREVTSSASTPSASSSPASAACRCGRLSRLEPADKALEPQAIAVGPEPRHHADREIREQRPAPLRLASENVREVHLDEWDTDSEQCVAHCETGVREGRGVDHCAVSTGWTFQRLDRLHQLAFMI